MALQDTDLLPLYRVSDSTNRKISVADLLSGAAGVWTEDSGKLYPNTLSNNVQIGGTAADPNITLAADGSITAAGAITSPALQAVRGSDSENALLIQGAGNNTGLTITGNGTVRLGGTVPAAPNIELDADGSAEFAGGNSVIYSSGTFQIGSNPEFDGVGIDINNTGNLRCRTSILDAVTIYPPTGTTPSIVLKGAGSGIFKGDVAIGDSTTTFLDKVAVIAALTPEQRETFAAAITAWNARPEPYDAEDPTTLPADTPLREAIVRATTAGKINLNADGSITAAGAIECGSPNTNSANVSGSTLQSNGVVRSQKNGSIAPNSTSFSGYYGDNETFKVTADGSITAAGQITANTFDLDALPALP